MRHLVITATVPTDAVTHGFLPAAERLGLRVTLLTNHPTEHAYPHLRRAPRVVPCDVTDARAVIDAVSRLGPPDAIFSNSDHLQVQTALAAAYFDLPAKDWRAAHRAKNKAEMRAHLARAGLDLTWHAVLRADTDAERVQPPYPCVLKPCEGVASEHVTLVRNHVELRTHARGIWRTRPHAPLLLEAFLDGPLHTLETLGDASHVQVLGGFSTQLGPAPHFAETRLDWAPPTHDVQERVLAQLHALGVGFGACHTEFVLTPAGPRLVEVNYRNIGDQCDLLLQDLLNVPLFELVLRAHLGETLPLVPPAPGDATVRYFMARDVMREGKHGVITRAPHDRDDERGGVRLRYRSLRVSGDAVHVTGTNRDYLGVLRAVAAPGAPLHDVTDAFGAELAWEVSACEPAARS